MAFDQLERARDPVLLIDRGATVLWANQAARQLLGPEGKSLTRFLPAPTLSKITKVQAFAFETVELEQPGKLPVRLSALVVDVSEADPSSNLLLISLKPVSAAISIATDDTISAMAHDIKNPLSAIFGYADALLDTPSGKDLAPKHRSVLSKIRSTSARAIDLVRNLQLLSDLQLRGFMKARVASDLNSVVKAVIEGTWREDKGNPKLLFMLGDGEMPVWLERSQLDRVVSNLFSNALRYTPPAGVIEVETCRDGNYSVLRIRNEGAQIPEEELPTIFDRYRRGSNVGNAAGTGLGLYIVKQILDKAGARIEVKSSKDSGTEFKVFLPAKPDSSI